MFSLPKTRTTLLFSSIGLALGLTAHTVEASSLLDITSPPVANSGNTGPINDPSASEGQWFRDVADNSISYSNQEFYDNNTGTAGTSAIKGTILAGSLTYDGGGLVTGFTIRASITNDLASDANLWNGANSHGETLSSASSLISDLNNVKLATEFADDGIQGNFPSSGSPYFGPESNIYARNYDELAWYSTTASGAYQVPTWRFGNVLLGQTVTKDLQFGLYTAVSQSTIQFLIDANDIFMNRSSDLKIGDYFEKGTGVGASYQGLALDSSPYNTINRNGNVSVFVPEPSSFWLMVVGLAGITAAGRRRRAWQ